MEEYFQSIEKEIKKCYDIAERARSKGFDPEPHVDIPLAKNMAERVERLIGAVAPQIVNSGVSDRISELEKKYGALAWEVALIIALEVSQQKFCTFKDKHEAMEVGIRTGFAYHTVGIVSAALEGFIELKIKKRKDGKEYFAAVFAGPIRGAGGTAMSVCLLIADYVRKHMGYEAYDPSEREQSRFVTELTDYHERVTNLQYQPGDEEIQFLAAHCPIEIDGDPTEKMEVSNFKDLDRIQTNRIRGGVCLVMSMLALKAPKVAKQTNKWGKDFDLEWEWINDFLKIQKKKKSKGSSEKKLNPDYTFISDLVAGRPVLTHPLRTGGFRLRYGRTRISGYSAAGIHPATLALLSKYIATGTQLKVERPGKAAAITPCTSIDGPIVRLMNGNVVRLDGEIEAKQIAKDVDEILFLGDFLVSYGDFFDRAHPLVPVGYCEEWFARELEKKAKEIGKEDATSLAQHCSIPHDHMTAFLKGTMEDVPASSCVAVSKKLELPIHPRYTYYWSSLNHDQLANLVSWLAKGEVKYTESEIEKIVVLNGPEKGILEQIGVPHVVSAEFVVIEKQHAISLIALFEGFNQELIENIQHANDATVLETLNRLTTFTLRDKGGTFVGARMGRPEKAKMRRLTGSPQVLFPVGDEGGRLRSFQSALEAGRIVAEFPFMFCNTCQKDSPFQVCETCGNKTEQRYYCRECGPLQEEKCKHGDADTSQRRAIDIKNVFNSCLKLTGKRTYPDLIKGVRGTSNKGHIPEHLVKGIIRAKHSVYVNKDGTTRYDMGELPLTHFTPKETGTSVEKLVSLGYEKDILGKELENENQILELKPQDMILPSELQPSEESADLALARVAGFVDELLVSLYGEKPYYKIKSQEDLVGQLVLGLAPHISAGIVGRIVGFSKTQAFFAHPMFHAAMRRDADGDEACVILMMDALLNFSKKYLPDTRGARTMDAPLVLTSRLVPAEVDDMVHRLDIDWSYPLELYEAAEEFKDPWDVKIDLLGNHLGTPQQYEGMGYTHAVTSINSGVLMSAYKTLPSMQEKLQGQMELARRIRAVDKEDVAELVIEKHLLKDIKGNLRKFSMQQFRCIKCNLKYRRPPLTGVCTCRGKIIFTVSEGSIVKYLEPAISLAESHEVSPYVQQVLQLTKIRIENLFGKEKDRQEGLGKWFG